jgi:CubicO group peptidase (beta-lactamase class C family)
VGARTRAVRALALVGLAVVARTPLVAQTTAANRWPLSTPAALGLNRAVLDSIDSEIRAGRYGHVDRMLVIRHGRIAVDASYAHAYDRIYGDSAKVASPLNAHDPAGPYNYYNPWWHPTYRRGDLHSLQSVTKTVTSVIIGAAIARGDFPSIDTAVLRFFDSSTVANVDDRKRRLTIRHLLTMTGGLDWNESLPYIDPNNSASGMEASPDWVRFTIDRPMMREPGTQWNYSSGESALLAHVFRQATGTDVEEYAARNLFAPLGIERWFWKRTPSGSADTEGGLYLEARDLARIWQLMLQDGVWNGRRVLSHEWVQASVAPQVAVGSGPNAPRYGYLWWLYHDPINSAKYVWSGSGFGGQFPMAFPTLDMVVVFNAWNILPGGPGLPVGSIQRRLARAVVRP